MRAGKRDRDGSLINLIPEDFKLLNSMTPSEFSFVTTFCICAMSSDRNMLRALGISEEKEFSVRARSPPKTRLVAL